MSGLLHLHTFWQEALQTFEAESSHKEEGKDAFIYLRGFLPPVREGVLGEIQVGEVSAAASQQGPKQLPETQTQMVRVVFTATSAILFHHSCVTEDVKANTTVGQSLRATMKGIKQKWKTRNFTRINL